MRYKTKHTLIVTMVIGLSRITMQLVSSKNKVVNS